MFHYCYSFNSINFIFNIKKKKWKKNIDENKAIKIELKTEIQVWKEKYNYLKHKEKDEIEIPQSSVTSDKDVERLKINISDLEEEVRKWKTKHADTVKYAEKLLAELKKKR
ncbi:MAG: hypothetical protein EU540_01690 [Promethearchaeota archaeon]|nr:MAG: hypothetical protein EU540_01690 [Candidatus Lokiarchaeota archaeon]